MFKREEDVALWLAKLPSIMGMLHPLKQDDSFSKKNFQMKLDALLRKCEAELEPEYPLEKV